MKKLHPSQIAEKFNVSERTAARWCQSGQFPNAEKVEYPRGEVWEVPESDLVAFVPPKRGPKLIDNPSDFALAKRRERERKGLNQAA